MEQSGQLDELDKPPVLLVSGGLQQYLIRQNASITLMQPRKGVGSDTTTFHDLPDSLQLHVFSFLDVEDLCRISCVCRHWYAVSSDDILWKRKLLSDIDLWNVIGHTTNPDKHRQEDSNLLNKEIYLRCSPLVARHARQRNAGFQYLADLLRAFWPKKTPKLAMFGPGLESSTSRIVRKVLEGESELFTAVEMFPGQFGGIGSGFTLKMADNAMLDLVTLYSSTRSEREGQTAEQRANQSRLRASHRGQGEGQLVEYELQPAVQELCRTIDGFIYVVDATVSADEVLIGRSELFAMVSDAWTPSTHPVVVLSCTPQPDSVRLSCIEITRQLNLSSLARPWQVHNCVVENMDGIESAFHWLIHTCYRI